MPRSRLVVVSNRLPISLKREADGEWHLERGTGGLVTALAPVLRDRGGIWIGWPGAAGLGNRELMEILGRQDPQIGYDLKPLQLTTDEVHKYYRGFSNEILWPLFHDLPSRCNFDPSYWPVYEAVNGKMAQAIAEHTEPDDYVWVQDYQLILVGRELRRMGVKRKIGFFLHIPFPPLDILLRMPWRFQILDALMEYDLVGFQTMRDKRNFLACTRRLVRGTRSVGGGQVSWLSHRDRRIKIGTFPISIDYHEFARTAESKPVAEMAWLIHEELPDQQIILGVDRLDYTKGIPERIRAYELALDRYPELRRKVSLVQVVVPSRTEVEEYHELRLEIERLVGQVNGRFTQAGWTPIQYFFRSLPRSDLVAYYRTSEIALITPIKDGMNLVAKEFCACSVDENGVVILSEFAGAATELRDGALLVNPHDIEGVAEAIHTAFHMEPTERRLRIRRLRRRIRYRNIFRWVSSFLDAAIAKNLDDFPPAVDFVPQATETMDAQGRSALP